MKTALFWALTALTALALLPSAGRADELPKETLRHGKSKFFILSYIIICKIQD